MNEQDKAFARRLLEEKRLSIEQVQEIRAESARSGRSFREVAASRGHLEIPRTVPPPAPAAPPPPVVRKIPTGSPAGSRFPALYTGLLTASFLIFSLLLLLSLSKLKENSSKDRDLAVEQSKVITEAERLAAEARLGYQRSVIETREARARQALAKARLAMARVDERMKATATSPDITLALNEAFVGYNTYLEALPDDADVRIERARTHQLRRNYDLAITDLERAAELKPERASALKDQVSQLRLLLARNPK
jgi:tetratricopeptide (TPR) repeat protein